MSIISASILSSDFANLANEVKLLEKAGVDMLHIDVMDGHFVPNLTFGTKVIKDLKKHTSLPLDVHLMIENAESYITEFANAGSDIITVHCEAVQHLDRTLNHIRSYGVKAGVALLPTTNPESITYIKDIIDLVLVMTVNPGFSGQKFITPQLEKIKAIKNILRKNQYLAVDGGINDQTISLCNQMGANFFVSGSFLYSEPSSIKNQNTAKKSTLENLRYNVSRLKNSIV